MLQWLRNLFPTTARAKREQAARELAEREKAETRQAANERFAARRQALIDAIPANYPRPKLITAPQADALAKARRNHYYAPASNADSVADDPYRWLQTAAFDVTSPTPSTPAQEVWSAGGGDFGGGGASGSWDTPAPSPSYDPPAPSPSYDSSPSPSPSYDSGSSSSDSGSSFSSD